MKMAIANEDAHGDARATGETIQTTTTHPWLTVDRGWVAAGEQVVTLSGTTSRVAWVHAVPCQSTMYNPTVAHDHTYAVCDGQAVVQLCWGQAMQGAG